MNRFLEKIFGYRGLKILIPLLDLAIVYGSIIWSFYIFKDSLDNFSENWFSFVAIWPYIGICYLILSHIFELDKPKIFFFGYRVHGISGYSLSTVLHNGYKLLGQRICIPPEVFFLLPMPCRLQQSRSGTFLPIECTFA
jgi:hypothetical protein